MNKQSYLASLKRSLSGLPADQIADILRDYDQHFIDAMVRGRSDEATARALGDPRKIALEFKAMAHLDAFQNKRSLANFGRMTFAFTCMVGFNFFVLPLMLVPPLVLFSFYLLSVSCLVGGTMIAASGVLGVDKIAFEHDGRQMAVVVTQTGLSHAEQSGFGFQVAPYTVTLGDDSTASALPDTSGDARYGVAIKSLIGALYVAAGLALLRLSRKLAGYLGAGVRRYLNANADILRNAKKIRA
jgi:uncharacterized membrane protein